jgi:hypothetical protein
MESTTRSFEVRVLEETRAVFADGADFKRARPHEEGFGFYSDDPSDPLAGLIECRETVTLSIALDGRERGTMTVGRCPEHAARLARLMAATPAGLQETQNLLRQNLDEEEWREIEQIGLSYSRTPLPGGGTLHYFPIVGFAHGLFVIRTVVLVDGGPPVVVQAVIATLCHVNTDERSRALRLCTDTRNGLSELARRLR